VIAWKLFLGRVEQTHYPGGIGAEVETLSLRPPHDFDGPLISFEKIAPVQSPLTPQVPKSVMCVTVPLVLTVNEAETTLTIECNPAEHVTRRSHARGGTRIVPGLTPYAPRKVALQQFRGCSDQSQKGPKVVVLELARNPEPALGRAGFVPCGNGRQTPELMCVVILARQNHPLQTRLLYAFDVLLRERSPELFRFGDRGGSRTDSTPALLSVVRNSSVNSGSRSWISAFPAANRLQHRQVAGDLVTSRIRSPSPRCRQWERGGWTTR
jgi:hypothetical protein